MTNSLYFLDFFAKNAFKNARIQPCGSFLEQLSRESFALTDLRRPPAVDIAPHA